MRNLFQLNVRQGICQGQNAVDYTVTDFETHTTRIFEDRLRAYDYLAALVNSTNLPVQSVEVSFHTEDKP